jgi:hypothetical protein
MAARVKARSACARWGGAGVVFEVDKSVVKPTLDRLRARSGKQVEFTDAVACTEYKTADECGHGQPAELKGLTRVFIETQTSALRDLIASEIAAAQSCPY